MRLAIRAGATPARTAVQGKRRLAVAGDSTQLQVLDDRTGRPVRVEVPGLHLAQQELSRLPQRVLDVLLELVSRDRAMFFLHAANIAGESTRNKLALVRDRG